MDQTTASNCSTSELENMPKPPSGESRSKTEQNNSLPPMCCQRLRQQLAKRQYDNNVEDIAYHCHLPDGRPCKSDQTERKTVDSRRDSPHGYVKCLAPQPWPGYHCCNHGIREDDIPTSSDKNATNNKKAKHFPRLVNVRGNNCLESCVTVDHKGQSVPSSCSEDVNIEQQLFKGISKDSGRSSCSKYIYPNRRATGRRIRCRLILVFCSLILIANLVPVAYWEYSRFSNNQQFFCISAEEYKQLAERKTEDIQFNSDGEICFSSMTEVVNVTKQILNSNSSPPYPSKELEKRILEALPQTQLSLNKPIARIEVHDCPVRLRHNPPEIILNTFMPSPDQGDRISLSASVTGQYRVYVDIKQDKPSSDQNLCLKVIKTHGKNTQRVSLPSQGHYEDLIRIDQGDKVEISHCQDKTTCVPNLQVLFLLHMI